MSDINTQCELGNLPPPCYLKVKLLDQVIFIGGAAAGFAGLSVGLTGLIRLLNRCTCAAAAAFILQLVNLIQSTSQAVDSITVSTYFNDWVFCTLFITALVSMLLLLSHHC